MRFMYGSIYLIGTNHLFDSSHTQTSHIYIDLLALAACGYNYIDMLPPIEMHSTIYCAQMSMCALIKAHTPIP